MNKKYYLALALLLIPLLILTACGGGSVTTSAAPTTTPPPVTTSPPTTTPPATTPPPTTTPSPTPSPTPTPTPTPSPTPVIFTLSSSTFEDGGEMPRECGFFNGNVSPQLAWSGAPEGTQSFVIIMEDISAQLFTHWVVYNIPTNITELPAGLPFTTNLDNGALQGINDFLTMGYGGPTPPAGVHSYVIKIFALDTMLNLLSGPNKLQVEDAMIGHILGQLQILGTYAA